MTAQERKRLAALLHATEYLFLENLALKLVLDYREVPHWRKLLDRLLEDQEILAGVHLKFSDLATELDRSADPTAALQTFLKELPRRSKTY